MKFPTSPRVCFILGPQKTATSTLTGILNCHPKILILYETDLSQPWLSKRGRQLVAAHPALRRHFHVTSRIDENYHGMAQTLKSQYDLNYSVIGDKIITLDASSIRTNSDCKYVFTTRNIRTWLAKDTVVEWFRTDIDAVPAAVDFIKFLIHSYQYENCIRVPMEQLIANNDATLQRISSYLEVDLSISTKDWSRKVGMINDPIKLSQPWTKGHQSSNIFTGTFDTKTTLRQHPFWDACLPVFDKYFSSCTDGKFSIDEINRDAAMVEQLRTFSPVPLNDLFEEVRTGKRRLPIVRKFGHAIVRSSLKLRRSF